MGSKTEKTWIETLGARVKAIKKNKELWCPHCAKFTPFKELTFHGKTEKGDRILSFNYEDIFEYEGFLYTCAKCNYVNEGMEIDKIEI